MVRKKVEKTPTAGPMPVVFVRCHPEQYARWVERAASLERPLSWWIRVALDWALEHTEGDPRQLQLPYEAKERARRTARKATKTRRK